MAFAIQKISRCDSFQVVRSELRRPPIHDERKTFQSCLNQYLWVLNGPVKQNSSFLLLKSSMELFRFSSKQFKMKRKRTISFWFHEWNTSSCHTGFLTASYFHEPIQNTKHQGFFSKLKWVMSNFSLEQFYF